MHHFLNKHKCHISYHWCHMFEINIIFMYIQAGKGGKNWIVWTNWVGWCTGFLVVQILGSHEHSINDHFVPPLIFGFTKFHYGYDLWWRSCNISRVGCIDDDLYENLILSGRNLWWLMQEWVDSEWLLLWMVKWGWSSIRILWVWTIRWFL